MTGHKIIEGLNDALAFLRGDESRGKIVPFRPTRQPVKPELHSTDLRPDPDGIQNARDLRRMFAGADLGLPCDVEPKEAI